VSYFEEWNMRNLMIRGIVVVLFGIAVPVIAVAQRSAPASEQQIEEALSPLPETMREGVAVRGFGESGELVMLQEGGSLITCLADDPAVRAFTITCYHRDMEAYVTRSLQLTKDGADTPERLRTLQAEIDSGQLLLPDRGVVYQRSGFDADISDSAMLIFLPNATAEATGLPGQPSSQHPWLREAGTGQAHVSIPLR
jgi:hypothetical protein